MAAATTMAASPRAVVAARLASDPTIAELARTFYKDNPLLKSFLLEQADGLLAMLLRASPEPIDTSSHTYRRLVHAMHSLATQTHASSTLVRRWAHVSASLRDDPDAVLLVCSLLRHLSATEPLVEDAFNASIDWTLSECLALGCMVRPYDAADPE